MGDLDTQNKTIKIIKIIWRWFVVVPLGILTAYDVVRQEVIINLPPFIDILPHWHWAIWTCLFLIAIIMELIFNICFNKKNNSENSAKMKSIAEKGGQAVVSGRDTYISTQQIKIEESPNIQIEKQPYIETESKMRRFSTLDNKQVYPVFEKNTFVKVEFSNNPKLRVEETTAKNVRAKIYYFRNKETLIGSTTGLWITSGKDKRGEMVDLLSNGKPEVLYLAMRFPGLKNLENPDLIMYGKEVLGKGTSKLKDFILSEKVIIIKIELFGEKTEKEFWFEFKVQNSDVIRIEVLNGQNKEVSK